MCVVPLVHHVMDILGEIVKGLYQHSQITLPFAPTPYRSFDITDY